MKEYVHALEHSVATPVSSPFCLIARPILIASLMSPPGLSNTTIRTEGLAAIGYPHVVYAGMKGYNGVAIFSRTPLRRVEEVPEAIVSE